MMISAENDGPETRCPTCGSDGVKACVDEQGRDLPHDHDGRPPYFPPGFDRIFPPVKCGARIATRHPRISQTCALPVSHEGDHSSALPPGSGGADA